MMITRRRAASSAPIEIPDYLCFTAIEAGTFTLTIGSGVPTSRLSYIEYSTNGRTWTRTNNVDSTEVVINTPTIAANEKVYWRGSGGSLTYDYTVVNASVFSSTGRFNASGHVESLISLSEFGAQIQFGKAFASLFNGCSTLVSAENLVLPSGVITYGMYIWTFRNCTALTTAPKINATSVNGYGLNATFVGCSSLTSIDLSGIESYVATAFDGMCNNCTSLNYVKCLLDPTTASSAFRIWLQNVAATGTFIQAEGVTWPSGASGIPSGWVAIEKRTLPTGYKQVEYVENPNYGYINTNYALELNSTKVEIAFEKQGTGASMPIGSSTYNYRYGALKVTDQAAALTIKVGVDYDGQVVKQSQITSVANNVPHVLQYVGNSSGFQLYLDGTLKKTETCTWNAVNPFSGNMIFSASANTSATAYFHVKPIYYLKIWNSSDALVVDYVACKRESDSVAGFYDMVGNVFHPSDNENAFTAGPEI